MKQILQRRLWNNLKSVTFTFLFIINFIVPTRADVLDQFARQGSQLISEAVIPNVRIRQCTCDEQSKCVSEMKTQAMGCIDTCWNKFSLLTNNSQELRKCFGRTDNLIEDFITCFEHNVDSCLSQRTETTIPKIDINKLFQLGVERIQKTKVQLTKSLYSSIRKIIDTAAEFGVCVKDCFLQKNTNGYCFDRVNCQPLVMDKKARKTLRRCTKLIDFKKEAGELCECSVKAGLSDLQQYCPMLRLIGTRQRGSSA